MDILDLWEEIETDPAFGHLRTEGIRLVPGYGSSRPKAFVVGGAPGATENTQGKPFCGASGRTLHQLMDLAGLYADPKHERPCAQADGYEAYICSGGCRLPNVWLTNSVKYRPPGNRTPHPGEILRATPYLRKEWALVGRPKLIVCVGQVAAQAMGQHGPYPYHGDIHPLRSPQTGEQTDTYITFQYHPAFGLRGGDSRKEMIERQWENLGENIEAMRKELDWDA